MLPLTSLAIAEAGDVIHHPDEGLAVVDARVGGALRLLPVRASDRSTHRLEEDAVEGWRLCAPGGLLWQSARDPAAAREAAARDPLGTLVGLLADLETPQTIDGVRAWIVGRRLVGRSRFGDWWEKALGALSRSAELSWDGRHLARQDLDPSMPGDPAVFLTRDPVSRFQVWRAAPPKGRRALLRAALEADHLPATLLCLRDGCDLDDGLAALLREAAAGEPWLSAALLRRGDPEWRALVLDGADGAPLPPPLTAALDRLTPTPRARVVRDLLEELDLRQLAHEDVAHALVATLAEGPEAALAEATAADHPQAHGWLTDLTAGARLGADPLPAARLFDVSLALARALAHRHAGGRAGGVGDARLRPDGSIRLGAATSADPRDDVRDAMESLARAAIGRLPQGAPVRPEDLLLHWTQLVPDAPDDWVAVATRALAPEPGLRPRNGHDLWEQLAVARTVAELRAAAPPRPGARLDIEWDTHIGRLKSRSRQTNQDALYWDRVGPLSLLCVADGISISTAGSGDRASAILVQTLSERWEAAREWLATAPDDQLVAFLVDTLAAANDAICARALELVGGALGQHIPMGTTVAVAVVRGDHVALATLGDSRAYLVGTCGAALLTGDQNLRGEWLKGWQRGKEPGLLNEGYALTGYCGRFDEHGSSDPAPPDVRALRLLPGEVLVLCTDGVTDYAAGSPAEAALLMEEAAARTDGAAACRLLVDRANAGGGGDNITVLVARQHEG